MAGKWKIFPVENIHKLSGCRKEHADHFPVENGSNFPVESENFPDTPMETLVMHPTNTEDARNGADQSQTCMVLETPNTLCSRNMIFLLLGFLANFPEYFPEKRVMRNGFFFSDFLTPCHFSDFPVRTSVDGPWGRNSQSEEAMLGATLGILEYSRSNVWNCK